MRSFILVLALSSATVILPACATAPKPAEVCSSEWIAPRADRAMNDFKKDTTSIFKKLRKAGESLADNGSVGPIQMFFLMNSIKSLGNKFENGHAMRDMRTLASTCNDPELIKSAMTDFMREQGIDERIVNFLNGFEAYTQMLRTGKTPDIKL